MEQTPRARSQTCRGLAAACFQKPHSHDVATYFVRMDPRAVRPEPVLVKLTALRHPNKSGRMFRLRTHPAKRVYIVSAGPANIGWLRLSMPPDSTGAPHCSQIVVLRTTTRRMQPVSQTVSQPSQLTLGQVPRNQLALARYQANWCRTRLSHKCPSRSN